MKKQAKRASLTTVHAIIEAAIVAKAAERARIDAELRALTAALNALETPPTTKAKVTKATTTKATKKAPKAKTGLAEQARMFLMKRDEATPQDFAKHTGTHPNYAAMLLGQEGRRVRRGVYTSKGN